MSKFKFNCDKNNFTNHQKIHGEDSSSGSGSYQSNEVHNQLHSILHEVDQQALRRKLFNFLNQCDDPDVTDCINYFKENWAYAYRLHAGINTDMHLERFHKTLKYMYLKGKKVKRLDKGICAIVQFVDRLISRHKSAVKVKEIRVRHETMTSLDKNLLIECEDGWKIPSIISEENIYSKNRQRLPKMPT
ncbi:uncharacterized protein LOC123313071 [Coccinella septempunctata]|uniref:uncharacterized protein LOC123313071 n=1 Tax=Coccinella septempunctata TaxID=41139 RepID=UPI001D07F3F9|nr:uncharacterized protein LOC123313071 [Coccinella septempunctata]